MHKDVIHVPEKGTYKWQLFNYWSDEYRKNQTDYCAYIALNFAGALDSCRNKLHDLMAYHQREAKRAANRERARRAHQRAIARLQATMTGAAMAYEQGFTRH